MNSLRGRSHRSQVQVSSEKKDVLPSSNHHQIINFYPIVPQIKVTLIGKNCPKKIQLYLITAPFPKNSQSPVPYRHPLPVPYRHPLPVPYNAPPLYDFRINYISDQNSNMRFLRNEFFEDILNLISCKIRQRGSSKIF